VLLEKEKKKVRGSVAKRTLISKSVNQTSISKKQRLRKTNKGRSVWGGQEWVTIEKKESVNERGPLRDKGLDAGINTVWATTCLPDHTHWPVGGIF